MGRVATGAGRLGAFALCIAMVAGAALACAAAPPAPPRGAPPELARDPRGARPSPPTASRSAPASAPETTPLTPREFERRVLALVNAERRSRGVAPLRASGCAGDYAAHWSQQLAQRDRLSHQELEGLRSACRARRAGENIGMTTGTPERMVARWMASAPHRRQLLDARYTHIGVGAARAASGRWYAVKNFLQF